MFTIDFSEKLITFVSEEKKCKRDKSGIKCQRINKFFSIELEKYSKQGFKIKLESKNSVIKIGKGFDVQFVEGLLLEGFNLDLTPAIVSYEAIQRLQRIEKHIDTIRKNNGKLKLNHNFNDSVGLKLNDIIKRINE
jgi:hypothetical protein